MTTDPLSQLTSDKVDQLAHIILYGKRDEVEKMIINDGPTLVAALRAALRLRKELSLTTNDLT